MASFLANGHEVRLHVYEEPTNLPRGVTLSDAHRVLPRELLFAHRASGSYAVFADWFRYKLIEEQGVLWVDTDVVCLKPFDHASDEVFAWQDELTINNAVLRLPRAHPLARWMAECCERPNRFLPYDSLRTRRRKLLRALVGNGRGDGEWGETGPKGLTAAARHLGCADRAMPFWHFYPIHFLNWHTVFDATMSENASIISASYGLHLWNEMTRRRPGFDKNARFAPESLFEQLCARYLNDD